MRLAYQFKEVKRSPGQHTWSAISSEQQSLRTSNLVYGWRTTTRISHKRHDLQRSKIKVERSRDQSEPSWPNAVPVSLEAGGSIQCRPNPAGTLLVFYELCMKTKRVYIFLKTICAYMVEVLSYWMCSVLCFCTSQNILHQKRYTRTVRGITSLCQVKKFPRQLLM